MATIKTVGTGKDFADLILWRAYINASAVGDQIAKCYGGADLQYAFSPTNANVANIIIENAPGESPFSATGVAADGISSTFVLLATLASFVIRGFTSLGTDLGGDVRRLVYFKGLGSGTTLLVEKCRSFDGSLFYALADGVQPDSIVVKNNIGVAVTPQQNMFYCRSYRDDFNVEFYNNTCDMSDDSSKRSFRMDNSDGFQGTYVFKNNLVIRSLISIEVFLQGDFAVSGSNNLAGDTSWDTYVTNNIVETDESLIVTNASGSDYTLFDGSVVQDVGVTVSEVLDDITGAARPWNQVYDIGAYEWFPEPIDVSVDVINWNVTSSMKSAYGGSITLANANCQYDDSLRATPIKVELQCTADVVDVSGTAGCFTGDKAWINGLIGGTDEAMAISESMIQFSMRSYFTRLSQRTLNTESAIGNANEALVTIATEYAGIHPLLVDFDAELLDICGPVGGSSILDEMRMVAQAGKAALFVADTGLLVAQQWKDDADSVDIVIPDEAIVAAQQAANDEMPPTRIKIRGCFFSEYELGEQSLMSAGGGGKPSGPGGGGKGKIVKCIKNGIPQHAVPLKVKPQNFKGGRKALQNALMGVQGFTIENVTNADEAAGLELEITPDATGFFGIGDFEPELELKGRIRRDKEAGDPEVKGRAAEQVQANRDRMIKAIGVLLKGAPPKHGGPAGGGGSAGGGRQAAPDKAPMERTEVQIEVTVEDPDGQAEWGIKDEGMENPYVPNKATLFDIAVRRFQEIKMERQTWQVNTTYLPCLQLNQVVQFKTPILKDCPQRTITGLLTSISVAYEPTPKAAMNLIIESFEDIGSTDYTSSDLIPDPSLVSSDWVGGNQLLPAGHEGQHGESAIDLYAEPPAGIDWSRPYVETTFDTKIGDTYRLKYHVKEETSSVNEMWLFKDGLPSPVPGVPGSPLKTHTRGADETYEYEFVATATSHSFHWLTQMAPDAGSVSWHINRITFKRTHTA